MQFRHGDLPGLVHSILLETGLAPHRLELEVTESVLIDDFSRAVAILRRLKALGVRIAMDDFGTGYSSLSYLQAFPFDKIKIDQAFISNLDKSPQSAAIVRAIIGLGRALSLPVTAEGVETAEQLAFLARESCDEVQGYLIGKPLPIEAYVSSIAPTRRKASGEIARDRQRSDAAERSTIGRRCAIDWPGRSGMLTSRIGRPANPPVRPIPRASCANPRGRTVTLLASSIPASRRRCRRVAGGAHGIARAETYPRRPVRVIVSSAAGGTPDIVGRSDQPVAAGAAGESFVVENRSGAGGNIGTEAVVRAPPDGYTLLLVAPSNAVNATLYQKLSFSFLRDAVPVAGLARASLVLELTPSFPITTVPEFIAYAKQNPGRINLASAGNGTIQHIAGELFKMMTGTEMVHVPYRSGAPAMTDLLAGQVQAMFNTIPTSIGYLRNGRLRALGVSSTTPEAVLPDVPPVARVRAGLRGELVVRPRRTEGHARRDRRDPQQRGQCRPRRPEAPDAVRRSGGDGVRLLAGGFRRFRRRRNRQVGQGGEVRRAQAGLNSRKATRKCCANGTLALLVRQAVYNH